MTFTGNLDNFILFESIVSKRCDIRTLRTRGRDSLDFHDVSVWALLDVIAIRLRRWLRSWQESEAQMNRLFSQMLNGVTCGDCIDVMAHMPSRSVDFVLTDPPYLVRYHDRSGRRVINDDNDAWLKPAFSEIHRVLKPDSLCVSFYGWNKTDVFMAAWREAGFRVVGHIVFRKGYASSARHLSYSPRASLPAGKRLPGLPGSPAAGRASTGTIPATGCIRHRSRCNQ